MFVCYSVDNNTKLYLMLEVFHTEEEMLIKVKNIVKHFVYPDGNRFSFCSLSFSFRHTDVIQGWYSLTRIKIRSRSDQI